MIKIVAVLCSIANPADCHDEAVIRGNFADISIPQCMMGALMPGEMGEFLAGWMKERPQYSLKKIRCEIGDRTTKS